MTGLTYRQSEILNIARAFGRVMVEDLARRFEVSARTIRKDLNNLYVTKHGINRKFHFSVTSAAGA